MGVLIRELEALYAIYHQGGQPELPELPIRYTAYAARQRQQLQGSTAEELRDFWRNELAGATEPLALPCDYPRPAALSYRGRRHRFIIPADLAADLKRLAQESNVSLFTTLFAAFQTLLFRYTGQEKFIVGVPTHGRRSAELQPLIGLFVNTVPLRCDLSEAPTFAALLGRVNACRRRSFEHQDLPFQQLVAELQTERDPSRAPLFQVMFVLQNWPLQVPVFPGLQVSQVAVESSVAQYDLTLDMIELQGEITATLEYSTDLFHAMTIERMAGHFLTLLAGIITDPQQKITHIPLLTPAERTHLLEEWNRTQVPYPLQQCVHTVVEAQAKRTPDAVAVECGKAQLTYAELDQQTNQFARYLQKAGLEPGQRVGILMDRCVELYVALLGILKTGAVYVPIDPMWPDQRIGYVIEDAGLSIFLSMTAFADDIPKGAVPTILLDIAWNSIVQEDVRTLDVEVTAEHLAYVIYTSGSTGRPKGVPIQHRSLVNYMYAAADLFTLTPGDRVLQFASISFDASAEEIFPTSPRGGTVVARSDAMLATVSTFLEACRDLRLSVLDLPTSYWHQLVTGMEAQGLELPDTVRLMIIGGEKALPQHLAKWQRLNGNRPRLLNGYGPTEATIVATVWELPEGGETTELCDNVAIGRPIANVRAYVLDEAMNLVPVGVPGELYLGGVGLAVGYLNAPDLTQQHFVPDPFSNSPDARLYKTGDRVRYLPDGNISYLGRVDYQVKLRGFRIELGEIETNLLKHPAVREAVAIIHTDQIGASQLVAYVVPASLPAPSSIDITSWLRNQLPEYMIPSVVVSIDKMPLSSSGKVDRARLPVPDFANVESGVAFLPPRDGLEQALADIWAEVLERPTIGVHDNFFDVGGHSLRAIQVAARVYNSLQVEVPLRLMFEAPTIAHLAAVIRQMRDIAPAGETASQLREIDATLEVPLSQTLVPIRPRGSRTPLFCVHPASGVVFPYYGLANYLEPDRPLYAIQDPGVEANRTPRDHVEEMAADYIEAIKQVQPHGPYHVAGWSFGGYLAYEMARQLTLQGEKVGLVGVIDTPAPDTGPLRARPLSLDARQLLHQARMILVMVVSSIPHVINGLYLLVAAAFRRQRPGTASPSFWVRLRWLWLQAWRTQLLKQAGLAKYVNAHADLLMIDLPALQRLLWLIGHHTKVDARYVPVPFEGKVTLFRAALSLGSDLATDPTMGWSRLALNGVEVHTVPGNHVAVLSEPYVRDFTRTLVQALQKIEGAGNVSTGMR